MEELISSIEEMMKQPMAHYDELEDAFCSAQTEFLDYDDIVKKTLDDIPDLYKKWEDSIELMCSEDAEYKERYSAVRVCILIFEAVRGYINLCIEF